MSDENDIEQKIQDKGLNAPRLTPQDIEDAIVTEQYYRFPGTNTTVCCIGLDNKFDCIGHSSCVSDANFDEEIGKQIARTQAKDEVWKVKGYELCSKIKEKD